MHRPGPPPQRPSNMNQLNFNRSASGTGGGGSGAGGAAPSPGYNYLPRPGSGAGGSTSSPFNRGLPFGTSSLPPHLAGFANAGGQQQQGQGQGQNPLNINDFPALGGSFNATPSGAAANVSYANSTAGNRAAADALNTDDFPALSDGFGSGAAGNNANANGGGTGGGLLAAAAAAANQEQASAAATLQHQRLAREQNQSQTTLNAARGGFGEPDRNYATKVGMQQPPGMSVAAQNWFSPANFAAAGGNAAAAAALGVNGAAQAQAQAQAAAAAAMQSAGGNAGLDGMDSAAGAAPMPPAKTPAQQVLTSPADRFGLVGLLNIIKMQDPDVNMLTMGSDLQTLGLSLNAQESLSTTFVTPWTENAAGAAMQVEPDFHLPSCYNVQPPPPPQSKIASFSDETLFFIFYSTPRDVLQEVAAQELYNRNWRFYRGGLNLWLTKEENVQPTHKDLRAEKGVYIFWDPASWSKVSREFVLAYDALEERSVGVSPAQLMQQQQQQQQQQGGPQTPQQQQQVAAQVGA